MDTATALLRRIPFFSSLSEAELERLAHDAVFVSPRAGEAILREGDPGDRMYVIESGAVQIWVRAMDGSDIVLARLEPGQYFGEQALLPGSDGRRNAGVRALQPTRLIAISRESLLASVGGDTDLLKQIKKVSAARESFRSEKIREAVFAALNINAGGESYRIEKIPAHGTVFAEGDSATSVYLVLRGRVRIEKTSEGNKVLAEILPGQFFGEVAILNDAPRSATAGAEEDLELAALDGAWFRAAHKTNASLRSLFDSLSSIYLLPHRGLLTLQNGTFEGSPCVTAIHNLVDGRRVVSSRLTGTAAFHSQVLALRGEPEIVAFTDSAAGVTRELHILDGCLVGLHAVGEWSALGVMLETLLDARPLLPSQVDLFKACGEIRATTPAPLFETAEVLCTCTKATFGQIRQAIAQNCHTLASIAAKTGATLVCGGCVPSVKELLGRPDWAAAKITKITPLAHDVRAFRIAPLDGVCKLWHPGQHVVIQARIENHTIQRAYTLSSAPTAENSYEITVKREPAGIFSRWLFEGREPDSFIRVSEPGGNYYLPAGHAGAIVCFAGGIGITPALAMSRFLLGGGSAVRLHVDYSVGEEAQAVCRQEFLDAAQQNPLISFQLRVTKRDGRIGSGHVAAIVATHPEALYFLCGSARYMETVAGYLREAGVAEESIRIEHFNIAGEVPAMNSGLPQACPVDHSLAAKTHQTPLEEAKAFVRQYYSEAGALSALPLRAQQVEEEFLATGSYIHTAEELAFAVRVAWRNATRCIGRLYWEGQGVAVRDFRHITTSGGMLDAIMQHIELAFNGGSLRPTITVFPQRRPDGAGPRVWSPQLFRYAGYQLNDGSILGDPANLALTRVAMDMGWNPPSPRTAFDLLPIIVQASGSQPEWRAIPENLRYEVPIVHPQFSWFADLGLRWYALPAVSDMLLDAGGIQYPAIPFNGWYMGTEIGARNFGDTDRYNLLPVVAKKMGLDIGNDRSLWKDRALVELNVAVLHSYEKAAVKMDDHHSASRAFNRFEAAEQAEGRPVYANWSWLVPPVSGCAVTVFHGAWQNIELKPGYSAQPAPWANA